jgi:hypothetical protein
MSRRLVKTILEELIEARIPYMVRAAAQRTGLPEEDLLSLKPTQADHLVRIPTGPYAGKLMDECGCDGTVETVVIV